MDVDGFSRIDLEVLSAEEGCNEIERRWAAVRLDSPRDGGGEASPNMKNFMKAPIRRTTDICPRMKPCVKESLNPTVSRNSGEGKSTGASHEDRYGWGGAASSVRFQSAFSSGSNELGIHTLCGRHGQ